MRFAVDIRTNGNAGIYRYARSIVPTLLALGRQGGPQVSLIYSPQQSTFLQGVAGLSQGNRVEHLCAPNERFVRNSDVVRRWIHQQRCICYFSVNYLFDPLIEVPVAFVLHDVIPLLPEHTFSDAVAVEAYGTDSVQAVEDTLAMMYGRRAGAGGGVYARYFAEMIPRLVDRADLVITVSATSRTMIEDVLPMAKQKLRIIPNGFDERLFHARRSPGGGRDGLARILFVGSDRPHKRLGDLLDAFERLEPSLQRRAALSIVSPAPLMRSTLERIDALKSHVSISIEIGITDSDLAHRYHSAAAVCLPSEIEGFGLVGVEAAACARPVIASDIAAFRETLGESAYYYPPSDAGALARHISNAILSPLAPAKPGRHIGSWGETAKGLFHALVDLTSADGKGA